MEEARSFKIHDLKQFLDLFLPGDGFTFILSANVHTHLPRDLR